MDILLYIDKDCKSKVGITNIISNFNMSSIMGCSACTRYYKITVVFSSFWRKPSSKDYNQGWCQPLPSGGTEVG